MTDLRTKRTRAMILNGFNALMQQKQFTKITVNDIAAAAFINRSTFYVHFTDKYELLETVFQGVLDQDAIDTSTLYEHPFRMLAQIKGSSLKNMIQYQAHDTEFVSAFFDFFVERLIDQRTEISELDKCFFIGRVNAIPRWIQRTNQKFNIFTDYDKLDDIFNQGAKHLATN
ncbi:TetR/AcrR family transcriptional regulator [Secundilactobacillus paracollinoides]|uniref:TetR/AcrR family transcriptional regulator n=1 Tax=Secundilactobacillus paracollinoides TaxID=240427 RepID=UPI0006D238AF|nr:TetR/AcrR family transcriptional regulator [Secundilactobacillus paracollinoides]